MPIAAGMKMAMPEIQRRARAAPNAAHSRRRLAKASSKQTGSIMATPHISAMAAPFRAAVGEGQPEASRQQQGPPEQQGDGPRGSGRQRRLAVRQLPGHQSF